MPLPQEASPFISTPVLAFLARFLPDKTTLSLEAWHVDDAAAEITLHVPSPQASVPCPLCHVQTARVHSRYARTLADLPWSTYAVCLQLRVRKFFCDHPTCPRQIFTERLPTVAAPWARRTLRLAQLLLAYGIALGGAAGARLVARLGRRSSPDTLGRLVRAAPAPARPPLPIIRVGHWASPRRPPSWTLPAHLEGQQ